MEIEEFMKILDEYVEAKEEYAHAERELKKKIQKLGLKGIGAQATRVDAARKNLADALRPIVESAHGH